MNQYRKALKGYTVKDAADNYLSAINQILADFGADAVMFEYEDLEDRRIIRAMSFRLLIGQNPLSIKIPLDWRKTAYVLKQQGYYKDDYHAYRVSLFNIREWLDAQLALLTCQMVELPQIFLPYMQDQGGKTFYEVVKSRGFNIGMD